MRSGFAVHIVGDLGPASDALHGALARCGVNLVDHHQIEHATRAPVRLLVLNRVRTLDELRHLNAQWSDPDTALAAVIIGDDLALAAMAAAIDCDDVLSLHEASGPSSDLARRLDNLRNLARRRQEWALRSRVAACLRGEARCLMARPRQVELRVLIGGRVGSAAGRLAEILRPARVVFAESASAMTSHLRQEAFDIVIFDEKIELSAFENIAWPSYTTKALIREPSSAAETVMVPSVTADSQRSDLLYVDERLRSNLPSDILRTRLRMLRRLSTIGRDLLETGLERLPEAAVDQTSLCLNGHFLSAYINQRQRERDLEFTSLELVPKDMRSAIEIVGYAGLPDWLRRQASNIKRHLRCEDLVCHLGEGRFCIVLQGVAVEQRGAIAQRLANASNLQLKTDKTVHDMAPA